AGRRPVPGTCQELRHRCLPRIDRRLPAGKRGPNAALHHDPLAAEPRQGGCHYSVKARDLALHLPSRPAGLIPLNTSKTASPQLERPRVIGRPTRPASRAASCSSRNTVMIKTSRPACLVPELGSLRLTCFFAR